MVVYIACFFCLENMFSLHVEIEGMYHCIVYAFGIHIVCLWTWKVALELEFPFFGIGSVSA